LVPTSAGERDFKKGKEADFAVLDFEGSRLTARRCAAASTIEEKLFALMTLADDRNVAAATMTSASRCEGAFIEFEIRQYFSAFSRMISAFLRYCSLVILSRAITLKRVNCVKFSILSSSPSTSHSSVSQSSLAFLAMARKDKMKQFATAPTSMVSGDQTSPGPPNWGGPAVSRSGKFAAETITFFAPSALAETT
jgi:hypothetical protein